MQPRVLSAPGWQRRCPPPSSSHRKTLLGVSTHSLVPRTVRDQGGAKLRVRVDVTPTHEHAGPSQDPRLRFPAGEGTAVQRGSFGLLRDACCPRLSCPLVAAGMPHLENMVLCRESQVSTLQSLFGEVLWSNDLFSFRSRRQTFPKSCDVFLLCVSQKD